MVRILVSAANSFDSFIPAFCHSSVNSFLISMVLRRCEIHLSEYPFALYISMLFILHPFSPDTYIHYADFYIAENRTAHWSGWLQISFHSACTVSA